MGYNILVVDDSSAIRKVLIKTIRMCKVGEARFWQANHGAEALQLLEKEWIDVIFTDINMPIMDGIQFLTELQKNESHSGTPRIVVTSETRSQAKERFRELGAVDVITKPFRPEEIEEVLAKILPLGEVIEDDTDSEGYDF